MEINGLLKQFNFANKLFIPFFFKNKRYNEINNTQKIGNNNIKIQVDISKLRKQLS